MADLIPTLKTVDPKTWLTIALCVLAAVQLLWSAWLTARLRGVTVASPSQPGPVGPSTAHIAQLVLENPGFRAALEKRIEDVSGRHRSAPRGSVEPRQVRPSRPTPPAALPEPLDDDELIRAVRAEVRRILTNGDVVGTHFEVHSADLALRLGQAVTVDRLEVCVSALNRRLAWNEERVQLRHIRSDDGEPAAKLCIPVKSSLIAC